MDDWKRSATTASRLREAMDSAGKKQVDLVKETGIGKGSLSNYLAGRYEPKQQTINKLAIALGVSEMWLWGYDVPKERSLMQKKNDRMAELVFEMREDAELFEMFSELAKLPKEQREGIKVLLAAYRK